MIERPFQEILNLINVFIFLHLNIEDNTSANKRNAVFSEEVSWE